MKIISSYQAQILSPVEFKATVDIYRKAVAFLIDCFDKEWPSLAIVENPKERKSKAEQLVHSTKYNTAKYDFDKAFCKFPSYLRRAAI